MSISILMACHPITEVKHGWWIRCARASGTRTVSLSTEKVYLYVQYLASNIVAIVPGDFKRLDAASAFHKREGGGNGSFHVNRL